MNALLRAKCALYLELLKKYDALEAELIEPHDIRLMDALMRDKDIQAHLSTKLKEV